MSAVGIPPALTLNHRTGNDGIGAADKLLQFHFHYYSLSRTGRRQKQKCADNQTKENTGQAAEIIHVIYPF
jgi:hypothetical protein